MGMELSICSAQGRVAEWHDCIGPDGRRQTDAPVNADAGLSQRNEHLLGDVNTRDADKFNALFADAVAAFNAKQTRPSRKMGPESSNPDRQKSYYDGVVDGTFCFGSGKQKERAIYEVVLQLGNKDDNGVTDSSFDMNRWKLLKATRKTAEASQYVIQHLNTSPAVDQTRRILKKTVERIANLDPEHLAVIRADLHADEPCGTQHVHLAFVLRATGYKNGMTERVGSVKALEQMGFKKTKESEYGIVQLHERIRDIMEEEMAADAAQYGYDPIRRKPETGEKRKRTDVDVFRQMAAEREELEQLKAELEKVRQENATLIKQGKIRVAELAAGQGTTETKPQRRLPNVGFQL